MSATLPRLRIGVLTCAFPPYRAGIGNVAERQARMLVEEGHEVEVLCPTAPGAAPGTEFRDGMLVHRLRPLLRHGNSALVPTIGRHMARFDAVYVHYPFFGGAELGALSARARDVPYLAYFHMDVVAGGAKGAVLRAYGLSIAPRILRGARRVFVSSLDYVRHSTIAGYDLTNLVEMPYSIDESVYSPGVPDVEIISRLGIARDENVVLFVGAMDEGHSFKGVPGLIHAFGRLRAADRARLILVGDGGLRTEYERMARDAGLDRVTFVGRVEETELVDLYRAARVTVLPSVTREEAFGVVLIESMACGTPVVASDLPGVRNVFRAGEEGLLVAPGDVAELAKAIDLVLEDDDLHRSLAESAGLAGRTRYARAREKEVLLAAFDELDRQRHVAP